MNKHLKCKCGAETFDGRVAGKPGEPVRWIKAAKDFTSTLICPYCDEPMRAGSFAEAFGDVFSDIFGSK